MFTFQQFAHSSKRNPPLSRIPYPPVVGEVWQISTITLFISLQLSTDRLQLNKEELVAGVVSYLEEELS